MNLSTLSHGELQKLKTRIEKEIESRSKKQRGRAMTEIKSIVAKYGLKLEEVISSNPAASPKARKGATRKPVNETARSAKKPSAIVYRHPENAQLTWSGGRGRPPQWIKDWKAAGRSLDEARVAAA